MREILAFVFFFCFACLSAQSGVGPLSADVRPGDSTQQHQVVLLDYSTFLGTVVAVDDDSLRMRVVNIAEPLTFPVSQLRKVRVVREGGAAPAPEIGFDDFTFVRSALPFGGRRRFKTVSLAYNVLDFNLNRHLQLTVGNAALLGLTFGQRFRTSAKDWLHLGLSNEMLLVPIVTFSGGGIGVGGDLTGLVTIGNEDQMFNLGVGMLYAFGGGAVPAYRVGVGTRLSPTVHVYGEMLAVGDAGDQLILLPTLNVALTRRRHRWSFGLATTVVDSENFLYLPLPYLSYAVYY
ncbi:KOW domain-containing RNA-binding protein [Neolewinella litorea]|uniref:Uncharacterized protein n=1 Tax=Neolewinella litorea TaxID=2562452 RepID=A0A4S4NUZ1_9BACT|nr:hypothetical protein [Neolewinella litorea]THH40060.1 hypothetical protein E4021_10695 [Neolewinella litorea]